MRAALQSVRNAAAGTGSEGGGADATGPMPERRTSGALKDLTSRGVTAVVAGVVALLVVVGAIVAFAANGSDGSGGTPDGNGNSSTHGGTGGAGDGGTKNGGADASQAPTDEDDGGKTEDDDKGGHGKGHGHGKHKGKKDKGGDKALPEGYREVTDDHFHFSMAMPEDFARVGVAGSDSGGVYAASEDGYPSIQVDYTSGPGDDAVEAWRQLERAVSRSSDEYQRVGSIHSVDWRGYPTVADWQFTRTEHGQRVHVLNRGFKVDDGRGHAILITCEADKWDDDACRTLRDTAFRTFRPA
jgi:hypothetical protein